jgi:hypothetical protein
MVVGGEDALQASPSDITEEILTPGFDAESSEVGYVEVGGFKPEQKRKTKGKAKAKTKTKATAKAKAKAAPKIKKENEDEAPRLREPATNSDYVPIPWKGRLGYVYIPFLLRYSDLLD